MTRQFRALVKQRLAERAKEAEVKYERFHKLAQEIVNTGRSPWDGLRRKLFIG